MDRVFQMWLHMCQIKGNNHFPSPAGHILAIAAWLCGWSSLPFPGLFSSWCPREAQVLFCRAAPNKISPQTVLMHGVVLSQNDHAIQIKYYRRIF